MVSGIRFMACSGAMGNTIASLYAAGHATVGLEIFGFEAGATNNPNRMGFFGVAGAPNSAVIVGQYQDRTHVADELGNDFGTMINAKFTGASTVEHSGVPFTAGFAAIPSESGTLLCRFTDPNLGNVITQQATFRAVNFTAGSGVPDISDLATGITIQAAQLQDTAGNAADGSWTEISSGGGPTGLSLADQSLEQSVHDFHLIISGTPSAAGRKINFGYFLQLEFL